MPAPLPMPSVSLNPMRDIGAMRAHQINIAARQAYNAGNYDHALYLANQAMAVPSKGAYLHHISITIAAIMAAKGEIEAARAIAEKAVREGAAGGNAPVTKGQIQIVANAGLISQAEADAAKQTRDKVNDSGGLLSEIVSVVAPILNPIALVTTKPIIEAEPVQDAAQLAAKIGAAPIIAAGGSVFAEDVANATGLYSKDEAKIIGTAGDVSTAIAAAGVAAAVAAPLITAAPAAPTVGAGGAALAVPAVKEAPGLIEKLFGKGGDKPASEQPIVQPPAPAWSPLALAGALGALLVVMVWRA